jgi:hypothetical protein
MTEQKIEKEERFTLVRTQSSGRGVLKVTCNVCGEKTSQFDKGLGRANIATWKTRHQHAELSSTSAPHDLPARPESESVLPPSAVQSESLRGAGSHFPSERTETDE